MRRTEQLQGLRLMKFEEVYGRSYRGELSQVEASEILGVSERTFRRWRDRYQAEGAEGLYDRRLGRASGRGAPGSTRCWTCWRCSTRATGISRPSTSGRSWWTSTGSRAATTGCARPCRRTGGSSRRRGAGRTDASGRAGRGGHDVAPGRLQPRMGGGRDVGPVVNEGELGSSTFSPGQVSPAGPLGLGQRWTVTRKREVALRLLRGEPVELLSRAVGRGDFPARAVA